VVLDKECGLPTLIKEVGREPESESRGRMSLLRNLGVRCLL
jgi:hypothetical protein